MQTLIQCFAAVQVDPSPILNPNASIISDKYPFIGNDTKSVTTFCNSRQRLFSCLSPLGNDCPKIIERLYVLGIDLEGLELATKVLCDDPREYLDGLACFQKDSAQLTQCEQQIELAFIKVQEERFITGDTIPSGYQGRLCE
nr:hypothetical protein BaRGS_005366 [Batillaria attramentaria]